VLVGRHPTRTDVASIQIDNAAGARAAVGHLLDGGSRRVAIILGPGERTDTQDREAGYRAALAERGIDVDPDLIARGDFNVETGYEAMTGLLPHRPDAVFATNDPMAVGAMRAILEADLRVPDDIAVAGFDDLPVAVTTDPPLTTVRQDIARVGQSAVDTLVGLLEHGRDSVVGATVIPAPLVVRQSTRPAPATRDRGPDP
jgi:LacI family transcriptional regulator